MTLLKVLIIVVAVFSLIIYGLSVVLSMKKDQELEKSSPFECGFLSQTNFWSPFSMHFFLSALIFLVFDIELVLLFPYVMIFNWKVSWVSSLTAIMFLFILTFGFLIEWSNKFLEWSY